ncbi:acyltransferase family protein [Demequina capsici]|uniref:Acyltransferase n=1 Tax=Demequina capsici TaxID=3075620 RepID=A0AA96FA70_9MICO|nr:acyltransferase [Demequina sp. OYTSA14]WNM24470.1 acyltransferase [Demequina sp. OYTSA14]
MGSRVGPGEMVDATPASRDRYADLLRVGSLLGVMLGHFFMAAVTMDHASGTVAVANVLDTQAWARPLTLVLQVMPVFFVVGGFAHSTSWRSTRARGGGYADFVRSRILRLLRPTMLFVAVWLLVALVIERVANDETVTGPVLQVAGQLLWFLGIYLIAVGFAPALLTAHERWGWRVLAALVTAVVLVDVLRLAAGVDGVKWLNFALVWLAVHQLGFFYADGVADRFGARRLGWTMLGGGVVVLALLVTLGPYSTTMVSYAGERLSNLAPPTVALLTFACAQAGALLLLRAPANRWLERRRVWSAVIVAGSVAMTAFLWHLTALIAVHGALWVLGVDLTGDPSTASFWWVKLAMLVPFLAVVVVLVVAFRFGERPPPRVPPAGPSRGRAVLASVAVASGIVGLLGFAVTGFRGAGGWYVAHLVGVPMTAWAAFALVNLAFAAAEMAVQFRTVRAYPERS